MTASAASRGATFAILPIVAGLDTVVWYTMRTTLIVQWVETGGDLEGHVSLRATMSLAGLAGIVLAALLAIPTSALVSTIAGAAAAAIGITLSAALPGGVLPGAFALALGHGMIGVAVLGAAARAFGAGLDSLRVAAFLSVNVALGLFGLAVEPVLDLSENDGPTAAVAGTATVLALVLASGLGIAQRRSRAEEPEPQGRRSLTAALTVTVVAGLSWSSTRWAWDTGVLAVADRDALSSLLEAHGITAIVFGGFAAALFATLHFTKTTISLLFPAGIGLLLGAFVVVTLLVAGPSTTSGTVRGVLVMLSVAHALAVPFLLAHVTGRLPARLATAVVAAFYGLVQLPLMLASIGETSVDAGRAFAWVGAIAAIPLGVALIVAPMRRGNVDR